MRLEYWISHKHLYRAENAGPIWEVAVADLVARHSVKKSQKLNINWCGPLNLSVFLLK